MAALTRSILLAIVGVGATAASAQTMIYPALPQPPAQSAYPYAFPQAYYPQASLYPQAPFGAYPSYANFAPYGLGGYGYSGYGYGGYRYGRYGYGMRGYYPPNPFGNMNMLPPNPPSPYYVAPTGRQYLDQAQRSDQARYAELMLMPRPR